MNAAERFFYKHAGFGYNPKTESREMGRRRHARQLAKAEAQGRVFEFAWELDPDLDSSSFTDEEPAWLLWECSMRDGGMLLEYLGGIDFGRYGVPDNDPYSRVVEAELALAYFGEFKEE